MDKMKSAKTARRNDRKQRKCQHVLEKETQVVCCATPTKNIAVCNAGLANGLSEATLIEHFCNYGSIDNIAMLHGKSCCFISYKQLTSAMNAFECFNGKLNIGQYNKPVYLAYVESLPCALVDKKFAGKPPGLILIENFITEKEELLLLSLNDFDSDQNVMKHRKVLHYGYEFRYDTNNVDKNSPLEQNIPKECDFLWSKLNNMELNIGSFVPDQLTVNHYEPGQGIPPHVDTHSAFEDPIMSLSLGSLVAMEFKNNKGESCSVVLPRRSLLIMSGECRYNWIHGITPRKLDVVPSINGLTVQKRETRVSFTFRKVRRGVCSCEFIEMCDTHLSKQKDLDIDEDAAKTLENLHVHDVYENVACHFSETRSKPWPNVLEFVQNLSVGSVLVDVGCGNGKYLKQNPNIYDVGYDRSSSLIDICRDRGFEVLTCNCLNLPLRSGIADAAISIAVIHHLSTEERRLQAVKEIVRVLRIGGSALIYVWAKDQNINNEKSSYLKQDRKNRKQSNEKLNVQNECVTVETGVSLPVHVNRRQFQHRDVLVPWKMKTEHKNVENNLFLRFYHVFEDGELEALCLKLGNVEVCKNYYDQGNWCIVIKKINNYV